MTLQTINERMMYDPNTGVFTARISSGRRKAGDQLGYVKIAGALEKARGMRAGFPDILILGQDMGADFIALMEVKAEGGRLTKEQREWRDWCNLIGLKHAVCRSIDDAREALEDWGLM